MQMVENNNNVMVERAGRGQSWGRWSGSVEQEVRLSKMSDPNPLHWMAQSSRGCTCLSFSALPLEMVQDQAGDAGALHGREGEFWGHSYDRRTLHSYQLFIKLFHGLDPQG